METRTIHCNRCSVPMDIHPGDSEICDHCVWECDYNYHLGELDMGPETDPAFYVLQEAREIIKTAVKEDKGDPKVLKAAIEHLTLLMGDCL